MISNGVDTLAKSQATGELWATSRCFRARRALETKAPPCWKSCTILRRARSSSFHRPFGGPSVFAANIRALKAAGCTIIIDDVSNVTESPFQDGPIALAVNEVSAAGVLYFSSAANSGNKDSGTASTWEGDFADGGAAPNGGRLHSFGTATFNTNPSGDKGSAGRFRSGTIRLGNRTTTTISS